MRAQHVNASLLSLIMCSNLLIASSCPWRTPYRDLPRSIKEDIGSTRSLETVHQDKEKLHCAIAHGYADGVVYLLGNPHIDASATFDGYQSYISLAAERGFADIVNIFLARGVNPDAIGHHFDRGPLNNACYNGHLDVAKLLLEHGANPNIRDAYGPLHHLVSRYCNQNACDMTRQSFTPDGIAKREAIARLLIQHGANANPAPAVNGPPLLVLLGKKLFGCESRGIGSMTQLLLDLGADPSIQQHAGKTALKFALDYGHTDAVAVLVNHQAKKLCASIHTGDLAALRTWTEGDQFHKDVLTARTEHDNTLLHVACDAGHKALIALLLARGADVTLQNANQDTPLHLACSSNTTESRAELVTDLLQHKAPVQVVNAQKRTPLMLAVCAKDPALVAVLLAAKSPIDSVDADRDTVLHLAARAGDITIAHCLARAQACCTQRNGTGKLPFELAAVCKHPEVAQFLQQAYLSEVLRTLPPETLRLLNTRINPPAPVAHAQAAPQSPTSSEAAVELIMHDSASCASSAGVPSGAELNLHSLSSSASSAGALSGVELTMHEPLSRASSVQATEGQSTTSGYSAFSLVDLVQAMDVISLSSASVTGTE